MLYSYRFADETVAEGRSPEEVRSPVEVLSAIFELKSKEIFKSLPSFAIILRRRHL